MDSLSDRDLAAIWHPATHFADLAQTPPIPLVRAKGAWLYPQEGLPIFDAISSWWTTVHGHGHPAIANAISSQVQTLDHVMFAGFTHAPAVELAETLLSQMTHGNAKVFYSDCGSAAIEVALKMSYQAHLQQQRPERRRFATLENSYHGETLGALAVCGHSTYRSTFASLMQDPVYLPAPAYASHQHEELSGTLGSEHEATLAAVKKLKDHAHELAALILEPMVQCAGKMSMPGAGYYRAITQAARDLGIHVISDEIAVGFCRTGKLLAGQWADLAPDMICLSKGLSGGVLPLACTIVQEPVIDAFRGEPSRTFLHSHTYAGNPIACAAGLASLQELIKPETQQQVARLIEDLHEAALVVAATSPEVVDMRQAGTIVAFDLDPALAMTDRGQPTRLGWTIRRCALARGVLLRPLHTTLYWMPPLCSSTQEVEHLRETTLLALADAARELSSTTAR